MGSENSLNQGMGDRRISGKYGLDSINDSLVAVSPVLDVKERMIAQHLAWSLDESLSHNLRGSFCIRGLDNPSREDDLLFPQILQGFTFNGFCPGGGSTETQQSDSRCA